MAYHQRTVLSPSWLCQKHSCRAGALTPRSWPWEYAVDCCCRQGPHLLFPVPIASLTSLVSAQKAQRKGRGRNGGMRSGACLCSGALLACAALLLLAPHAGEAQGLIMGDQMGSTPSLGRLLDPGPSTPTTPAATADSTDNSGGAAGGTDSGAATGGGEGGNHLADTTKQ